jgi:hypothetical protein
MMKTLTAILAVFLLAATLNAQVSVAPSTVNLSDVETNGFITVKNTSGNSMEVNINIKNEQGPSASENVNIFPDKFVLKPFEEKRVEVSVNPDDMLDGEFLGTPEIISRPLGSKSTTENVKTAGSGNTENKTVFGLYYFKRGKSAMNGLEFVNLSAYYKTNMFYITSRFKCDNSDDEFDGTLRIKVFDENGNKIKETSQKISINCSYRRDVVISTDELSDDVHVVEATFSSCKKDGVRTGRCDVISRKVCVLTK